MAKEAKIIGTLILFFGIVGILLISLFGMFYTVNAGQRAVVLTWGAASNVAVGEGLHLKIPIAQKIVKMNIQTQKYEADASASSKDLQVVTAHVAINYHLIADKVPEIYSLLGVAYSDSVIQPMEQEVVKATTAKFTAEELITKREEVRVEIKQTLKDRLLDRGIAVEEVAITNFDFSKSFNDAIEQKVTALQLKQKADNDLERIKIEAEQVAAQAEGQKQATILKAEADKQAKIAQAEGDARAIELVQNKLSSSPNYIEFYKLQKWNGQLSQVVGTGTPLINVATG